MYLVYLDDSRDEKIAVATALLIPADRWNDVFKVVRQWRRDLKRSDGIYVYKELHATEFVAGRGRIAPKVVSKHRRSQIFGEALDVVATLPGVALFNAIANNDEEDLAYERILNRINRTLQPDVWNSYAMLLWDEGKNAEHRKLTRRMRVTNPIPSKYGEWPQGTFTKNIPLDRIIEDPLFKDSAQSYFIQLVDFCAYALLRREHPLASKSQYGIDKAFARLKPVCFKNANYKDPDGVVRAKLRPSASGGAGKQGLPPAPRPGSVLRP
jgi:Protein of unknown function (DUF3800)